MFSHNQEDQITQRLILQIQIDCINALNSSDDDALLSALDTFVENINLIALGDCITFIKNIVTHANEDQLIYINDAITTYFEKRYREIFSETSQERGEAINLFSHHVGDEIFSIIYTNYSAEFDPPLKDLGGARTHKRICAMM